MCGACCAIMLQWVMYGNAGDGQSLDTLDHMCGLQWGNRKGIWSRKNPGIGWRLEELA